MVTCSGSLATINCELRQVRKEATVAVISGAEVWLGRVATFVFAHLAGSAGFFISCCNLAAFFVRIYRCYRYLILYYLIARHSVCDQAVGVIERELFQMSYPK